MHNVGIYAQDIPTNPYTGAANIEYKIAEMLGYQKIDVLNNHIYDGVEDEEHLEMLADEAMVQWDLLEIEDFVVKLPHLANHFDVVEIMRPRSVKDLAITLAIIRPAKRYLLHEPVNVIESEIWDKPNDGAYYYKKSHSYAFALSLVVMINLLSERFDL
jgi:hypothetical protein